jgi:hypothetical protein
MSDLSDLHGVYPTTLRWNAESGFLAISVFNAETGERELQEIELGEPATFVMDLATRQRGYGLVKAGVYDMILTPVGSPAPAWPNNEEYKPALGCWMWNPTFGELRLETSAAMFRQAVAGIWDKCRTESEAANGKQPVIRFADRVRRQIKNKSFFGPVIQIVGWTERNLVPSWREREPTVPAPAAMPLLPASSAPAPAPAAKRPKSAKAKRGATKPGPDDPIDDILGGDSIPRK